MIVSFKSQEILQTTNAFRDIYVFLITYISLKNSVICKNNNGNKKKNEKYYQIVLLSYYFYRSPNNSGLFLCVIKYYPHFNVK